MLYYFFCCMNVLYLEYYINFLVWYKKYRVVYFVLNIIGDDIIDYKIELGILSWVRKIF